MSRITFFLLFTLVVGNSLHAEGIKIKTRAPKNQTAVFHYRVPQGYDAKRREAYRILIYFGGRNTSGQAEASGILGWAKWCDDNGVFIVAPGFRDDNYWEPKEWSGQALQKALAQLKKQYNVCTTKLLFYGYSAGSQASNLFPAWRPDLCRAWVSHACGVFHTPHVRMKNVPGLVTCGDADTARYIIGRNFVEACRKKGVNVIWKSFPNHPHDVPPDSLALARAFLGFYHQAYAGDLTPMGARDLNDRNFPFVGDDQDNRYYPAASAPAHNIFREDRVPLPNRVIADAWGRAAE